MACQHLVILKKPYVEAIVDGRKRIESRFARRRPPWLGAVDAGDRLILKYSGGPVAAVADVAKAVQFADLDAGQVDRIRRVFGPQIGGDDAYWQAARGCRYGLLVWLERPRLIRPIRIAKRDWRSWVVLRANEDFGLPAAIGGPTETFASDAALRGDDDRSFGSADR